MCSKNLIIYLWGGKALSQVVYLEPFGENGVGYENGYTAPSNGQWSLTSYGSPDLSGNGHHCKVERNQLIWKNLNSSSSSDRVEFVSSVIYGTSDNASISVEYEMEGDNTTPYANLIFYYKKDGGSWIQFEHALTNASFLKGIALEFGLSFSTSIQIKVSGYIGGTDSYASIDDVEINLTGPSPLPVELSYFDAVLKDYELVELNWSTLTEWNNDYFQVEKSIDGENFEKIDAVNAKENSIGINYYQLKDEEPYKGTSYYRLVQIDQDGKKEYSNLITIYNPILNDDVLNVQCSGDLIQIYYSEEELMLVDIKVVDIQGRIIYSNSNQQLLNGLNYPIQLNERTQGYYIVSIGNREENELFTTMFYSK